MKRILAFFLLITPVLTIAQNNSQTIRGSITDKLMQTPIIGATIQLSNLNLGCISDSVGNYVLKNLPPDRYELKIVFFGYKTLILPILKLLQEKKLFLIFRWKKNTNNSKKL